MATFTVRRPLTVGGRRFERGESIELDDMQKAAQLVALRWLEPGEAPPMQAARPFNVGKRKFKRGDRFPDDLVSVEKRNQLLDNKFIQPTISASA